MQSTDPGFLLTLEGSEGCGKSTQVRLLKDWLDASGLLGPAGLHCMREPGASALGERVRAILLDKVMDITAMSELLLFCAARAQLVDRHILPLLQQGACILMDRFVDSTTAYQGYGRGIDLDLIQTLHAATLQGRWPDLTIVLDMDVDQAFARIVGSRGQLDRMELSGRDFFERVRQGFLRIAASRTRVVVLDATQSPEDLHRIIVGLVSSALQHKQACPPNSSPS